MPGTQKAAPGSHKSARPAGSHGPGRRLTARLAALTLGLGLALTALPGTAQAAPEVLHERRPPAGERHHAHQLPVTERQFEHMFPERDAFFTYDGLVEAAAEFPAFATTGSEVTRRQEVSAFLAQVSHETGGLKYVVAQDESTYPIFCDDTQPYGCPAGTDAYYGRGAIMLSWNFNYRAAGEALGLDLLNNPWLVEQDPEVAWLTALWYWNTQTGQSTMTGHEAMVRGAGFGETIRALNGPECDGVSPEQVAHRVELYRQFTRQLHTPVGRGLSC